MFIQSVFIRKNTSELQEKLRELGYKTDYSTISRGCIATSSTHGSFVVIDESRFDSINPHVTWNNGNRIDCGYNEELFLALAALRDDKPDYQWYVWDDENDKGDKFKQYIPGEHWMFWWWFKVHKATVEEIIKYFK